MCVDILDKHRAHTVGGKCNSRMGADCEGVEGRGGAGVCGGRVACPLLFLWEVGNILPAAGDVGKATGSSKL